MFGVIFWDGFVGFGCESLILLVIVSIGDDFIMLILDLSLFLLLNDVSFL